MKAIIGVVILSTIATLRKKLSVVAIAALLPWSGSAQMTLLYSDFSNQLPLVDEGAFNGSWSGDMQIVNGGWRASFQEIGALGQADGQGIARTAPFDPVDMFGGFSQQTVELKVYTFDDQPFRLWFFDSTGTGASAREFTPPSTEGEQNYSSFFGQFIGNVDFGDINRIGIGGTGLNEPFHILLGELKVSAVPEPQWTAVAAGIALAAFAAWKAVYVRCST